MGGARIAVFAVLLVLIVAAADWEFQHAGDASARDAHLVYCLAPAHVDGLVSAAASLGLARPGPSPGTLLAAGRELSPGQWRAADDAGFQRACDAYAAASMPGQPSPGGPGAGDQGVVGILLPVVAGALLTLAVEDFREEGDRRWALADELRTNWQLFGEAARSFADECVRGRGMPSSADLDARRRALLDTVRKVRQRYGAAGGAGELRDALLDGELGERTMRAGWETDDEGKTRRRAQVTRSLDSLDGEFAGVADALGRRVWLRLRR